MRKARLGLQGIEREVERVRTLLLPWKVLMGRVNGGHPDFATAQATVDFAAANGYHTVWFPGGSYGPLAVSTANMQILCEVNAVFDGGISAHALDISAADVRVVAGKWGTTAGGGTNYDAVYVNANRAKLLHLYITESDRYGIHFATGGDFGNVLGCFFTQGSIDAASGSVYIAAGATYNAVVGNSRLAGNWTNNGGATNKISDNFNS